MPNHGVIIENINEEEDQQGGEAAEDNDQETEEVRDQEGMEEDADDYELWNGLGMRSMDTYDGITKEMHNPADTFGIKTNIVAGLERKAWMTQTNGHMAKFQSMECGETSGAANTKRSKMPDPTVEI